MRKNNTLKERLSINIDDASKSEIGLEAKKAGVPLSEYVRFILEDRAKILNADKFAENQIRQESLDRLQIENERLYLLIENAPSSSMTEEEKEEMDALQSENEALRADMELLRMEVEQPEENDLIISMKEKLLIAETHVEEVEEKYAVLQEAAKTEKETLIAEHKKRKQELIDEVNALTCSEMTDEEAELIAQHEKEFNSIVAKLNKEEASSAEKNLLIEELQKKVSDYENKQVELANTETEKIESAEAKIAKLEEELDTLSHAKQYDKEALISAQEDLEETNTKLGELRQYKLETEEGILEASRVIDDLREELRLLNLDKEQSAISLKSQIATIEQQEGDLEKMTLQLRQLLTEQEEKEQLLAEIEALKKAAAEEREELESTSNYFSKNAERAIRNYEKEIGVSRELRSQCTKQEELIGKYDIKLNQFMSRISELETELRKQKSAPKSDAYSDLQISEFAEYEMKLYADCLEFLRAKHKDVSNKHLLLASLYNSVKNKQTILVSTPYTTSLKTVIRSFRA